MDKIKTLNTLKGPIEKLEDLVGRVLYKAETVNDEELHLYLTDTHYVRLHHFQDCCESVYIESVVGDLNDLIGEPLLLVEEVCNYNPGPIQEYDESYTWTFYKFATRKGYVDVRWYGTSNGYYSEGVSVDVVIDE